MKKLTNTSENHSKDLALAALTFITAVVLVGCATPIGDNASKYVYENWKAEVGNGKTIPTGTETGMDSKVTFSWLYRMKVIKDFEYTNYVRNFRRATTFGEFGSDSIKIILDSLVAVTGGSATKAALGAASAGVTGATTSLKKNVLFDQSITTFITKMDGLRLTKWNEILCKMGRCPEEKTTNPRGATDPYTVAEAFSDIEEYGHLGTLDAALRDIDSKASAEKTTAKDVNDKINKVEKVKEAAENSASGN